MLAMARIKKSNKRFLFITLGLFVLAATAIAIHFERRGHHPYALATGDIVFQEGFGTQATAVKAATDSRWSHVGVVFERDGEMLVLEALQPVRITPLEKFVARNRESFYAMRLKDRSPIDREAIAAAGRWAELQLGKDYDFRFQRDDRQMYCSELVWKIYREGCGIELCQARPVREYDLHEPTVAALIEARYGNIKNLPLEHPMVAPSDLADSELLIEVPKA